MTTIVFEGRTPTPHTIAVGMQGEHNAETIALEGLPEYGTPALNVVLPDGTGDVLSITDGTVTLTRNHTPEGGTLTAWVTEVNGDDLVWKSEKFYMSIGSLPEIEGPVEQRYPDFVEEAISDVTALVQDAVAAKDAVFGMSAQAETLPTGSPATASYSQGVLTIGVPNGSTPEFSIGTVQAGDTPSATITGTIANPVLNLTLPKGDQGDPGDPPTFGIGTVTTGNPGTEADVQINGYGGEYSLSFTIPRGNVGQTGATGATPNLTIGTVQSGSTAGATITGTAESPVLNLTLPKGDKGDPGSGDVSEVRGETGLTGTVTSSGALKANLKSETQFVNSSKTPEEVKTRIYPVSLDSNGKLVVSVPYPYIEAGTGLTWAAQSGTVTEITNTSGSYTYAEDATTKTFSLDTSGASAGTYGPSQNVTGSNGAAINIPNITVDQYGRVTSINNKVLTCVDTHGSLSDMSDVYIHEPDANMALLFDPSSGKWMSDRLTYPLYIVADPNTSDDVIECYDINELWNAWYRGRQVRIVDGDASLNEYMMEYLREDDDGNDGYEYLAALKRLNANGTWETRQFLFAEEDGIWVGREMP